MDQILIKTSNSSAKPIFRLIDPRFQGVNKIFVLFFEKTTDIKIRTEYFLPTVEEKD